MTPEQIRIIQERLSGLGYRVPITGLMDEATMQAIAAYNTIQRPREAGAFSPQNYPKGDFTLQSGEGFASRGQTPTLGAQSSGLAPFLGPAEGGSLTPSPAQREPEPAPEPRPMTIRKAPTSFPDHPMPPQRPVELARDVLSRSEPSGPSSRELWERYNRSESPADFVRADQAMLAGRASGGRAPTGKHDAVAKALEIIHHLIMRGR